jgi:molybdopterin-biosynthesis enzyme MoeA-like protein
MSIRKAASIQYRDHASPWENMERKKMEIFFLPFLPSSFLPIFSYHTPYVLKNRFF